MTDDPVASDDQPPRSHQNVTAPPQHAGHEHVPLEGMPGGDGAPMDTGAEAEIWVGRTHWKHFAGRLIVWGVCNVALAVIVGWVASRVDWLGFTGAFWAIAGVVVVSGIFVVGRVVLAVLGHRYRLTSQRLFIERGILSRSVDQTELIRVDDVRLHKSFLNRVFGLGSVGIVSTDTSDREVVIEGIREAEKVAEAIRTHMRLMRRRSLFVENL